RTGHGQRQCTEQCEHTLAGFEHGDRADAARAVVDLHGRHRAAGTGQAARLARLRSVSVRNFLRRRISFGVISTSSSSSMKSSACSSENLIAGVSWIESSLPEARMFVSGLVLIALTVRSLSLAWMPTSCPS